MGPEGMIDQETQTQIINERKSDNTKIVGVGYFSDKVLLFNKGLRHVLSRMKRMLFGKPGALDEKAPCVVNESSAELIDPAPTQSSELGHAHVLPSTTDARAAKPLELPPEVKDEVEDFKHEAKAEVIPKSFALG